MNMLDIDSALALTGKNIQDMETIQIVTFGDTSTYDDKFSIEKFCYYLLSPEFIQNYAQKGLGLGKNTYTVSWFSMIIGQAITEYQRRDEEYPQGNETPLIELLSEICKKN